MIRMRDDDVLVPTRNYPSSFGRFRAIHEAIKLCPRMMHVPALVIEELRQMPEALEYLRNETAAGRMEPEFHGMWHSDYGALSEQHVREHLAEAVEWMEMQLQIRPRFWYTPWGSTQDFLKKAAQ